MELLQRHHGVELAGEGDSAHQQYRRHARRHRRHEEQNGQKRGVPQREALAHAEQAAGVGRHAQAHDGAQNIEPLGHVAVQQVQHQCDKGHHHEYGEEHHAPGHNRPEVRQQQHEAQRVREAGGRIGHQQAQAHDDHGRGDNAPGANQVGARGVAQPNPRGGDERTAAQTGEEEVPRNDGSPNGFVGHLNHLT